MTLVPQYAVYAGDLGVKYLQIDSLAHGSISLPRDQSLVPSLYPIRPPFAFEDGDILASVYLNPVTYAAVLPYRHLGASGCTLITLSAAIGISILARYLSSHLGLSRRKSLWVGLLTLIGTPVWFYGVVFWEHGPAAFLCLLGTLLALRSYAITAGLALGVAVTIRPEAALFLMALVVARVIATGDWRVSLQLLGAAVVAFVGIGQLLPGEPFIHHMRNNFDGLGIFLSSRLRYALSLSVRFLGYCPIAVLGLYAIVESVRRGARWESQCLALTCLLFLAGAVALAPNDGGKQWGARYLFPAYPILVIFTLATHRKTVLAIVTTASIAIQIIGMWDYTQTIRAKEATLQRLAKLPGKYIVTPIWFVGQEAALLTIDGNKEIIRAESSSDRQTAVNAIAAQGESEFYVAQLAGGPSSRQWQGYTEEPLFSWEIKPFQIQVSRFSR
jgi:hypothetical protein